MRERRHILRNFREHQDACGPEGTRLFGTRFGTSFQVKTNRDQAGVDAKLEELREACRGEGNLLHPIRAALAADASIGEVCNAMRDVFGEYKGGAFL